MVATPDSKNVSFKSKKKVKMELDMERQPSDNSRSKSMHMTPTSSRVVRPKSSKKIDEVFGGLPTLSVIKETPIVSI